MCIRDRPNFAFSSLELTAIRLRAKFEVSSFNRSRDIRGGSHNSKTGSRDPQMTHYDIILQVLDISPIFYLSVKFDANSFIDDRYMATSRLRGFGCEMPIRDNFGEFLAILTPWNCEIIILTTKGTHFPRRHALWDIARWNRLSGLICSLVEILALR